MHTALMEASMDGHVEVAKLLLDSGAQVRFLIIITWKRKNYRGIFYPYFTDCENNFFREGRKKGGEKNIIVVDPAPVCDFFLLHSDPGREKMFKFAVTASA